MSCNEDLNHRSLLQNTEGDVAVRWRLRCLTQCEAVCDIVGMSLRGLDVSCCVEALQQSWKVRVSRASAVDLGLPWCDLVTIKPWYELRRVLW